MSDYGSQFCRLTEDFSNEFGEPIVTAHPYTMNRYVWDSAGPVTETLLLNVGVTGLGAEANQAPTADLSAGTNLDLDIDIDLDAAAEDEKGAKKKMKKTVKKKFDKKFSKAAKA